MTLSAALATVIAAEKKSENWLEVFSWKLMSVGLYAGAEPRFLSAKYWQEEESLPGGNHFVLDGYTPIIQGISQNYDVKLNTLVSKISVTRDGVKVSTNQGEFAAHGLISTLPLGVLKKGDVIFDPPLPDVKKSAIKNLGMGVLNRIVLKFPQIFWPKSPVGIYLSLGDKLSMPCFLNYAKLYDQPILVAFTCGQQARMLEAFSDKDLIVNVMVGLENFFGKNVPQPNGYLITRWGEDPFSYGSYSYIPVGASGDDYDILAESVEDRVFFAGEATNRQYLATVHGAYLSGIREADRIIEIFA